MIPSYLLWYGGYMYVSLSKLAETKKKQWADNYAFIDAQNLYLGIREQAWRLDYSRFRVYLEQKYKVVKTYLFIGYVSENQELYAKLKTAGFILKFKPVHYNNSKKQGNVDADMVLHIMRYYREYDRSVIVTSDGDFDTVIKYLNKKKKLEILLSPMKNKCSALLKTAAKDKIDFMDNLRDKLEISRNEKAPL